jgi:hypothetical protein
VTTVPSSDIRSAQKNGSYAAACQAAKKELSGLSLTAALERVLARAGTGVLYDALASHWIVMAIEVRQLSIYQVNWAAARFEEHLDSGRDCVAPLRRLAAEGESAIYSPQVEGDEVAKHLGLVDEALEAKDLQAAMRNAYFVPYLPLDRALRLTVLAGETSDPRFEAASQRFIVRVLEEIMKGSISARTPANLQVKKLVNCFVYFHHGFYGSFARDGLQGLVRQLREMEPIDIDFEQDEDP